MKNKILILALMLGALISAQDLPTIIPPSPEARKMIEYGNIPVSYNTGVPAVNVPLYSFDAEGVRIPIELSYHASGTRVNDSEGITGLKWSLMNGGGFISRTVNGRPDEDTANDISGWLNASKNLNLDNLADTSSLYLAYMEGGCVDLQPDEYNYSLPTGVSGKFIFGENQEIIQIPQNENVKIEKYFNTVHDQGWKIRDTNGFLYVFITFDHNNTSGTSGQVSNSNPCPITYVKSSWFLDKVVLPSGDEITYSYSNDTYRESFRQSETQFLEEIIPVDYSPSAESGPIMSGFVNGFLPIISYANHYYNLKRLQNIQYNDLKITFNYSQKSSDTDRGKKLDNFHITYKNNHITGYNFKYLFNSKQRMFLNQLDKVGNGKTLFYRGFEYHNYNELPEQGNFSIDEYGYYNAKTNSRLLAKGTYRLEDISVNPNNYGNCDLFSVDINGADRSLNTGKVDTGTLSKIIYPTKGWTTFEYEPNIGHYGKIEEEKVNFSFSGAPQNQPLGWQTRYSNYFTVTKNKLEFTSLRVTLFNEKNDPGLNWQRPSFDLIDESGTVHYNRTLYREGENISSCDDVRLDNLPNGKYRLRVRLFNSSPTISSPYVYSVYIKGYTAKDTLINDKYYGGIRIKSIANFDHDAQLESKKTYDYQSFSNSSQSSGKVLGKSTFFQEEVTFRYFFKIENAQGLATEVHIGEQNFTRITSNISPLLAYSRNSPVLYENVKENFEGTDGNFSIKRYYKNFGINRLGFDRQIKTGKLFTPHSLEEYANGILYKEEQLDDQNVVVKKVEHDYNFIPVPNDGSRGFVVKNYRVWDINNYDYSKEFKTGEYEVFSRWFVNKKQTTTTYFSGNRSMVTSIENSYDNPKHKFTTKRLVTNSKGETLITQTKYAHDVNDQQLINRHRIAEPVQTETSKKVGSASTKLSAQETIYKDFSGLYLPQNIQTLKGVPSSTNTLEDRVVYHSYDSKGNPKEVSKKDGTKVYYVWGYNGMQPIAKIEGYSSINSSKQTAITNAITASNLDVSATTENTLRSRLTSLRSSFPEAQVTSFTYDPLIGVTSMTDPRGYTVYYEYDEFNRLKFVKDEEKMLVSENKYNYKN